jgi:hypothetical protein
MHYKQTGVSQALPFAVSAHSLPSPQRKQGFLPRPLQIQRQQLVVAHRLIPPVRREDGLVQFGVRKSEPAAQARDPADV